MKRNTIETSSNKKVHKFKRIHLHIYIYISTYLDTSIYLEICLALNIMSLFSPNVQGPNLDRCAGNTYNKNPNNPLVFRILVIHSSNTYSNMAHIFQKLLFTYILNEYLKRIEGYVSMVLYVSLYIQNVNKHGLRAPCSVEHSNTVELGQAAIHKSSM